MIVTFSIIGNLGKTLKLLQFSIRLKFYKENMYTCSYVAHNDFGLTRPRSDVVFICMRSSAVRSATLECGHICRAEQGMRKSLHSLFLLVSNLFLNL